MLVSAGRKALRLGQTMLSVKMLTLTMTLYCQMNTRIPAGHSVHV